MKRQKSLADKIGDNLLIAKPKDKPTGKQRIITMSIYLLILLSAIIFPALQLDAARQENLQLKNERADAFCKSQSYEKVTGQEQLTSIEEINVIPYEFFYKDIEPFCYGGYKLIKTEKYYYPFTMTVLSDMQADMKIEINFKCLQNVTKVEGFTNITETRNFEAGYYNQMDNSIYCQAEPDFSVNITLSEAEKYCQNVLFCDAEVLFYENGTISKCIIDQISSKENCINSINYQKTEKFPIE